MLLHLVVIAHKGNGQGGSIVAVGARAKQVVFVVGDLIAHGILSVKGEQDITALVDPLALQLALHAAGVHAGHIGGGVHANQDVVANDQISVRIQAGLNGDPIRGDLHRLAVPGVLEFDAVPGGGLRARAVLVEDHAALRIRKVPRSSRNALAVQRLLRISDDFHLRRVVRFAYAIEIVVHIVQYEGVVTDIIVSVPDIILGFQIEAAVAAQFVFAIDGIVYIGKREGLVQIEYNADFLSVVVIGAVHQGNPAEIGEAPDLAVLILEMDARFVHDQRHDGFIHIHFRSLLALPAVDAHVFTVHDDAGVPAEVEHAAIQFPLGPRQAVAVPTLIGGIAGRFLAIEKALYVTQFEVIHVGGVGADRDVAIHHQEEVAVRVQQIIAFVQIVLVGERKLAVLGENQALLRVVVVIDALQRLGLDVAEIGKRIVFAIHRLNGKAILIQHQGEDGSLHEDLAVLAIHAVFAHDVAVCDKDATLIEVEYGAVQFPRASRQLRAVPFHSFRFGDIVRLVHAIEIALQFLKNQIAVRVHQAHKVRFPIHIGDRQVFPIPFIDEIDGVPLVRQHDAALPVKDQAELVVIVVPCAHEIRLRQRAAEQRGGENQNCTENRNKLFLHIECLLHFHKRWFSVGKRRIPSLRSARQGSPLLSGRKGLTPLTVCAGGLSAISTAMRALNCTAKSGPFPNRR